MPVARSEGFAIIIPARHASTRYPGKPLAMLRGADGVARSLIERSWRAAVEVASPGRVWVATDDARIADAVRAFGGQVVMTPETCRNGTERCAAAIEVLGEVAPVVVNLQGDAPLTPAHVVAELAAALAADAQAAMVTPALRCSASTYAHLVADQAAGRVGGTTLVFDDAHRALYFSKWVIPHLPDGDPAAHEKVHLHLGVYAYRPSALAAYAALPPSPLEQAEGLEQLRFLESGLPVRVVPFDPVGWDCIELNNPEDVPAIEAVLRARGID
ncbi:MAG: 3-deoxy-manno-octulosonate cytidylyltransferase [Sphingomonadales bacterium]|nr:3-deoxy-manno-octulosonate cytidylyltransferase [Sphingomonadales bacterium]MDE2570630.1 3-deoxy-manno-octulosonate cytidylyltransferase [Sphingomonadales bacterium]